MRIVIDQAGMDTLDKIVRDEVLRPIAEAVANDARRYVPILTGELRDTIRAEDNYVYCGDVAADVDYHLYQEFGTSKMAAQPYMRPALYTRRSL